MLEISCTGSYTLSGTFVWYDIIADDGASQITCNGTDKDVATLNIPLVGIVSLLDVLNIQTLVVACENSKRHRT